RRGRPGRPARAGRRSGRLARGSRRPGRPAGASRRLRRMLPLLAGLAILQAAAAAGWLYLQSGTAPASRAGIRTGHVAALGAAAVPGVAAPNTTAPPAPPPPPTPAALHLQSQVAAALGGTS